MTLYEHQLVSVSPCPVLISVEHRSAGQITFPDCSRQQQTEFSGPVFKWYVQLVISIQIAQLKLEIEKLWNRIIDS